MFEEIEFVLDWFAEVESAPGRVRQVALRPGLKFSAEVCPVQGNSKLADLRFTDGTTARHVPFARFAVAKRQAHAA